MNARETAGEATGGAPGGRACRGGALQPEDRFPLAALAALAAATAAWWALALWPSPPGEAPAWLARARWVCFNARGSGLPDRSGWILLVGQPLGVLALLLAGWGGRLAGALARAARTGAGRTALATAGLVGALGVGAAGMRVAGAAGTEALDPAGVLPLPPRLNRPFPEAPGLVDQLGHPFTLASLGGRPALVTFAYAHCETVCPLLVRAALAAREELGEGADPPAVVAITLDPWRDTPGRLPAVARSWGLTGGDFVVGGTVPAVEDALDRWGVARVRDPSTGDLTHPSLVLLVEGDGTLAYAATGGVDRIVALGRRLR